MRPPRVARAVLCTVVLLGACGDDSATPRDDSATDSATATGDATSADVTPDTATDSGADTGGIDTSPGETVVPDVESEPDAEPSTERIDDDVEPCESPEYWPYSIASPLRNVRVHFRTPDEEAIARDVLGYVEYAWLVEVDQLGFRAPLADVVRCGSDARLDVFLWRDAPEVFTDVLGSNPGTSWDDAPVYIVLDTRGFTAGEWLDATVAHEFNHALQAAYDWTDSTIIYEGTATFIEDVVYDDDDNYLALMYDFQQNPDWSIDRDDGYETWFMYGFAMYLHYLHERFFKGDARFIVDLWTGLQSPEWAGEPDFEDSIDDLLAGHASSFLDSVVEFQRWRWYVEARDDGRHLEEAGGYPEDALPAVEASVSADGATRTQLRPMILGTMFVDVTGAGDAFTVALDRTGGATAASVQWVVQALPGVAGSDGELVPVDGVATVQLVDGARTLAITALPGPDVSADPDDRSDKRYTVTLAIEPTP